MKQRSPKSSRQNLKRLIVVTLISAFVFTSVPGINRTFAVLQGESDLIEQSDKANAAARGALDAATQKALEATVRLGELREFNTFKEPDINSLTNVRRLTLTISLMFNETDKVKLQDQLTEAQRNLRLASDNLTTAKNKLTGTSANVDAAKKRAESTLDAIKPKLDPPELDGLAGDLNAALEAIYTELANLATRTNQKLQPFTTTTGPTDLTVFQNQFGDVPNIIQFNFDLQDSWPKLAAQLKKVVTNHDSKVGPVTTAIGNLQSSVKLVATNLKEQITGLAKIAQTSQSTVEDKKTIFTANPTANEKLALETINEAQRVADALGRISRLTETISALAKSPGIEGFDETKTQAQQKILTDNLTELRRQTTVFRGALAGDGSLWIQEKIRLYYFTDIPRLVQTLNPSAQLMGGDPVARQLARNSLLELGAAEDAQSEANAAVSSLKRRVARIREELRAANEELRSANLLAQAAANDDARLNRRPAGSVSDQEKNDSAQKKKDAEAKRAEAQKRADELNDQSTGLAADLRKAEAALEDAQAVFERAANKTIRAAQVESAAFANARDNTPFWFAEADATSPDPTKRVEISSSMNGENAIFVRGRREDVTKVQDIVAKLDEPAPQARMTLWKIELNSDATEKGAEKFNKALAIVEKELAETREKIANTLSVLLGAVSEEAERAAFQEAGRAFERKDCHEKILYSRTFPATPVDTTLSLADRGVSPGDTDLTGRNQRLKRYALYSPEVQSELGIRFIDELGFDNPKQFGLKDPGSATTLNEALIILLLTDRVHRDAILQRFQTDLRAKLGSKDEEGNEIDFRRLYSMLGFNSTSIAAPGIQTTRQQQELIYAIRGSLLKHLVGRIARLQERVDEFVRLDRRKRNRPEYDGSTKAPKELDDYELALHQCLQEKLPKIFDTIHDEFPISSVDVMNGSVRLLDSGEGTIGLQLQKDGRPFGPPRIFNLRPSPARVAAADGMLDVYTKAFEDDIDRVFVQPMLVNLRKKLKKSGIGFGVIQRTSMLATNRLVARVDPRATAELSVGQETNLLQGLQSIAQLTLAAQTGGALGALGQLRSISPGEKDAAEIYGITSGSAFQVTPIFDPTGQALRFKFDFVDTTLVREPRGTTNPRLPRVERHTVNTEVQLANLEIREVSRFESDSKIGLPTTYWGGLPLLKDLPGVRPIPLIGWFVRRKGSNAIAQRSLIFAQTTMSPTIGDILDLFDTSLQRR
jgi:hypothetical protein